MSAVAESAVADVLAELVAGVESATLRSDVAGLSPDAERTGLEEILVEGEAGVTGTREPKARQSEGSGDSSSDEASSADESTHEEATSAALDSLKSDGRESSSESEAESQDTNDSGDSEEETKSSKPPPRDARRSEGPRTRSASRASSKRVQAAPGNPVHATGKLVAGGPSVRLESVVMPVVDVIDYNPATGKYLVQWEDRDLEWEKPDNIRENHGLLLDQAKRWVLETKRKIKFSVWRKKAGPRAFSVDHKYQCAFEAVELVFETFGVGSEGMGLLKTKNRLSSSVESCQYY